MLRHNCCHFSDALCIKLGLGPIPAWVHSLADAGAALGDAEQAAIEELHHIERDIHVYVARLQSGDEVGPGPEPEPEVGCAVPACLIGGIEEFEDTEGNVMSRKVFNASKRRSRERLVVHVFDLPIRVSTHRISRAKAFCSCLASASVVCNRAKKALFSITKALSFENN